jgi:enoyl-CoA hydratase/carnithine racemase
MTLSIEHQDGVALLRLDRGVTNAINLELVHALAAAVRDARENPQTRGLVLCSAQDKFFSIGFEIPQLFELPRSGFEEFYRAFNRMCLELYALPKPTFAAMTGHAIAGGCVLALCCDYRFIADARKLIGLNEIKLGVPVPYVASCVLRQLVGARVARDIEQDGEFLPPKRAQDLGLVDQVLPLERVVSMAVDRCRALGSMPAQAFAMIKRNRTEAVEQQILEKLEGREHYFIDCWYAEDTRARLKAAMEKF